MHSLKPGLPLRKQDERAVMTDLSDMLLKIAKLYQLKDFDPESSVLLAEWVMEEYKHTDYEIVKQALSKPPMGREKTWRLTPEVIGEWIEITRQRIIDQAARIESEKRQTEKIVFPELEDEAKIDRLLNDTKSKLMAMDNSKSEREKTLEVMKKLKSEDETRRNGFKSVSKGFHNEGDERQMKLRKIVLGQKGALWRPKNFYDIDGLKVPGDSIEEAKGFVESLTD